VEERRSPRIVPGSRAEIGLVNAALAHGAGLFTRGGPPRIFTTLGRHRRLFRRWLWFAGALMPGGKLPREETELVILRVAHNTGSEYEWSQHERIGRRAGLSEEQISRVRVGADVLCAADEMHEKRQIGDGLWEELSRYLDEVLLIELCMLIGHYEMLAMTLNTIGVEPERPVHL
jgi:AhpD family alkylhydroperoxidase